MGCGVSSQKKIEKTVVENIPNTNYLKNTAQSFISANPKKFTEVYKVGKPLGSGSFGEVRLVTHRITGQERAVKIFRKDGDSGEHYQRIRSEIAILKQLDHPTVIKLFEFFEDDKRVFLILEKCNGGELFEEIFKNKYLSEKNAAIISKQLFSVIAFLHEKNIVHRDLKPENILLEEKEDYLNIKLIDFGAATFFNANSRLSEMIGSAFYLAPEVARYTYNELCDEWSCGVILYILLSGSPPFPGNTNEEIIAKVKNMNYSFNGPIWESISEPAKDLIKKLLVPMKNRITAKEALSHPWILGQGSYPTPSAEFVSKALDNLRHFSNINRFRDAISAFISSQIVSSQDTKELRELFKSLDENGDGKLSIEEMKHGFAHDANIINPDEYIEKIMKNVDTDGNGFIDYNEFLKATLDEQELYSKHNLKVAFDIFDLDHSGKISSAELQQIFCLGNVQTNMWDEVVSQADKNSDGEIDLDEFCKFVVDLYKAQ
jgi:calcium-dependent protein kinase